MGGSRSRRFPVAFLNGLVPGDPGAASDGTEEKDEDEEEEPPDDDEEDKEEEPEPGLGLPARMVLRPPMTRKERGRKRLLKRMPRRSGDSMASRVVAEGVE